MLDSLGSTLTHSTISSFFTRFGKNHKTDELSFEEAIQCLETELGRPSSEKKRLDSAEDADTSVVATPVLMASDGKGNEVKLDELDFSGPGRVERHNDASADRIPAPEPRPTAGMQQPLIEVAAPVGSEGTTPESSDVNEDTLEEDSGAASGTAGAAGAGVTGERKKKKLRFRKKKTTKQTTGDSESSSGNNTEDGGLPAVERVINVKSCPLCHRPRMNSKAEMDIITHLAVCASQDWNAVDKIVVGNFVTASQAQRKWYTKVLSKVSAGDYKLGAVGAFFFSINFGGTELMVYDRTRPISLFRTESRASWRRKRCKSSSGSVFDSCIRAPLAKWTERGVSGPLCFLPFNISSDSISSFSS